MKKDSPPKLKGALTDLYLKALRAWIKAHPPKNDYDICEGHGFSIRARTTGTITFFYLYQFKGKRRFLNLGAYAPPAEARPPFVTLAEARAKYLAAAAEVGAGTDPMVEKPAPPPEPVVMTVGKLIPLYLESIAGVLVPRSVKQQTGTLNNDLLPAWENRAVSDIHRPDAIELITEVQKRAQGQARNVKKAAQTMFEYAVAHGYTAYNPFVGVQKQVRGIAPRPGDRVLSDKEIRLLWDRVKDTDLGKPLMLMLLTGQRPGEVTGMMWSEIEGDWWQINWRRIKTEINPNLTRAPSDHRIFLTPLAKSFLPERSESDYVFPARGRGRGIGAEGGLRPGSISHELTEGKIEKYLGLPRWTPKDLRRTLRTGMARLGVPEEHAEAVLNHIQGGVKGVYNLYKYDKQKKVALIKWSRHIESLLHPTH